MKLFLKHIFKIVLVVLMIAFFLDFVYTKVYETSKERNKVQSVINGKKNNLDVLILGSSRAYNHIVTNEFTKNNFKAFNYGISGSTLEEIVLLLQIMIEKKWSIKNLILEVDINVNSESFSNGTRASFMPFLRNSTISKFYKKTENFSYFYYLPFCRYIAFETKIGFREMFFSILNKKTNSLKNGGFYPLNNIGKNMSFDLSKHSPKKNKNYNRIKKLCILHKINLIVITTPMCKNTINRDYFIKLKRFYPEINSFENVVTDDKYFSSCGHMNVDGATIFTEKIITFLKESKNL